MNKNSKHNRNQALKNFAKGHNTSNFLINKTVPGGISQRNHTITIGYAPRRSKRPKVGGKG